MAQEKWLVDGPKIIDLELVRTLKVGLFGGQVDIVGHDEPGTRVEVHSVSGKDLKITIDGDSLEIDHPQLGWENWMDVFTAFKGNSRADVSIMVPRDVALRFGVVSASGLISGLTGTASISTVSGDIVVDGHTGALQINSVNGELSVRGHTGSITARTVSGDFTASGDISKLSSDSVSGDVFLDVTGAPDELRVKTVSGNITTRLAAGVAAQYRINTVSGRLQLDDSEITGVRGSFTGKYGTLDKSWLEFSANTVSGHVSVLHAVAA
jgi:Putative adhesin